MPSRRTSASDGVRRRPKDRKAQIARVAAEAFSIHGYHAVGMDDIAARVGITATALYRHYSGKYELFRDAVLALGQQLADATAFADNPADGEPEEQLRQVFSAVASTAIVNRDSGGLYRWEWRYLEVDDRTVFLSHLRLVNRRIQRPLLVLRPELIAAQRWMLSTSAISVIGSVVDHRVKLPVAEIRSLLLELATTVALAPLAASEPPAPPQATVVTAPLTGRAGRYEALLHHSLTLFNKQGYRETTMGEIAAAVGIPTSAIYRYFPGKRDVLAAVFRRAADRVAADLSVALSNDRADPAESLHRLVAAFVASSFANPELGYLYYTERVNLTAGDQALLLDVQRATVRTWVELLCAARPHLATADARFSVHAAMALVMDVGLLADHVLGPGAQDRVCTLVTQTLGV